MFQLFSALSVALTSVLTFSSPALAATAPDVPATPVVGTITATSVAVTWTAPPDGGAAISGYEVYRDGVKLATTTARQYSYGSLAGSTAYNFTISACNSMGCSAQSTPAKATTYPAAVTGLRATPGSGQLTISWTAATPPGPATSVW